MSKLRKIVKSIFFVNLYFNEGHKMEYIFLKEKIVDILYKNVSFSIDDYKKIKIDLNNIENYILNLAKDDEDEKIAIKELFLEINENLIVY